ncbi:MAG: ABC transporter permease, partial [Telluria sp.]
MKRNVLAIAATAACAIGFSLPSQAQVSGETIKIGMITDLSGVYSDIDGNGGAEAIRMAIADAGGMINGK